MHDTLKCSLEKLSSLNPLAQPRLFAEFAGEKVKGNSLRFHSARANFVLRGCKISHQPIKQNTTAFFQTKRGVALQILANVMADARHKMPALLSGSRQHLTEEKNTGDLSGRHAQVSLGSMLEMADCWSGSGSLSLSRGSRDRQPFESGSFFSLKMDHELKPHPSMFSTRSEEEPSYQQLSNPIGVPRTIKT